MAFERRQPARLLKDSSGLIVCSCGCGRHPVKPRKTWFSESCVESWKMVNDPATIRRMVWRRDRGKCAICGCNSPLAFKQWLKDRSETVQFINSLFRLSGVKTHTKSNFPRYKKLLKKWSPVGDWTYGRSTAWDADHIVPVSEGGGLCGIDNYRTLCHPCHKTVTKDLQQRLTKRRQHEYATTPG